MKYYPIFLDMKDRAVLVVGGGYVALQKIEVLLKSGARIKVVTKELIAKEILSLNVPLEIREYTEEDILGISVVVAATNDSKVNALIYSHSKKHNVLLNAVDDKDNCDFILGAIANHGDITVTVSTGGHSPIMAKKIRDKIDALLGEEYEILLKELSKYRTLAYGIFDDKKRKIFFDFLTNNFDELLENPLLVKKKYEELLRTCSISKG